MKGERIESEEAKRLQRSWNMSRVRSKDTGPEKMVRSWLWRQGFRFRKNVKKLPGCPDIVLPKYKTVIDVRGCFWHRHPGCPVAAMPKSNSAFWWKKFSRNVNRDCETETALKALGWRVIVVWECMLEGGKREETLNAVSVSLTSLGSVSKFGEWEKLKAKR